MKQNYSTTTRDGKTINWSHIIWERHHGKVPKGMIVHHINGDVTNNRIENLKLVTRSEHTKLHPKGSKNSMINKSKT